MLDIRNFLSRSSTHIYPRGNKTFKKIAFVMRERLFHFITGWKYFWRDISKYLSRFHPFIEWMFHKLTGGYSAFTSESTSRKTSKTHLCVLCIWLRILLLDIISSPLCTFLALPASLSQNAWCALSLTPNPISNYAFAVLQCRRSRRYLGGGMSLQILRDK